MMLHVRSHNSGVVYNNSTISHHSLIVHECIANSVPLDSLKYCFDFSDFLVYEHLDKKKSEYQAYNLLSNPLLIR